MRNLEEKCCLGKQIKNRWYERCLVCEDLKNKTPFEDFVENIRINKGSKSNL